MRSLAALPETQREAAGHEALNTLAKLLGRTYCLLSAVTGLII